MKKVICIMLLLVFAASSVCAEGLSDLFTYGTPAAALTDAGLQVATDVTPAAAMQQLRQQDAPYDLYLFPLPSEGLTDLLDAGLPADLCENSALAEAAAKLPPALQTALMRDGQWLAFPVQLTLVDTQLVTTADKLAAHGLSAADIPTMTVDFLDSAIGWYRSGMLDGVGLLSAYNTADKIVLFAMNEYLTAATAHGGQPDYQDGLFKRLMEKALTLAAVMEEHQAFSDPAEHLFEIPSRVVVSPDPSSIVVSLELTNLHPCGAYVVGAVAIIHPNSAHRADALALLADELGMLDAETRAYLTDAASMRTVSIGAEYVDHLAQQNILPDLAAQLNNDLISIEQCITLLRKQ